MQPAKLAIHQRLERATARLIGRDGRSFWGLSFSFLSEFLTVVCPFPFFFWAIRSMNRPSVKQLKAKQVSIKNGKNARFCAQLGPQKNKPNTTP